MVIKLPLAPITRYPSRPLHRYGKFLTVGMMNAVVDLIVFNLFVILVPAPSPWAISLFNTVAVTAAIANSYIWNRHWTFADRAEGSMEETHRFIVQALVNIIVNDVVIVLANIWLTSHRFLPAYATSNLSKALAMFLSSMLSYLVLQWFVFPLKQQMKEGSHS